jgi:hypothetical protein
VNVLFDIIRGGCRDEVTFEDCTVFTSLQMNRECDRIFFNGNIIVQEKNNQAKCLFAEKEKFNRFSLHLIHIFFVLEESKFLRFFRIFL